MELSERQTFKISAKQKQTLKVLHKKYKINTSQFIRDAIDEKLHREKDTIFRQHKEVATYLAEKRKIPF